ncbi:multidrug effflux MFS transporter [Pseudoflavitalea sp. G-6-1-2]|uniref:MFS transporter n=1 Tax=Pseudoflavitalea sp. G-6-1-2 TaxID=2728841 RepID=UPI00146EE5F3|nr:MFS transporter [Pseudoflavitalea sp. G-6-1-2]NML20695.1 multidrug effflux MFS transporter [Pseudoflavitalea sp. G-6-1-2]
MRRINGSGKGWNTVFAFALIPLSGFAMDIYIPSLPDMALQLQTTPAAIQLTLTLFIVSYGIAQLLVGGLIDSFGRYWPNLISIFLFSIASFIIATTSSLEMIYAMRILQGITVAVIAISKRAFFIDMFAGEELKKYTSMFSLIWSIAPIVAPFLGGFFQIKWGWTSNFMFLTYFGFAFFIIELLIGGESIKEKQSFKAKAILGSYAQMLKAKDFTSGIILLGLGYAMLLVYGMSGPFLIEGRLHLTPEVTGYISLLSGIALFVGSSVSRILIKKPFVKKLTVATLLQLALAILITFVTLKVQSLYTLMLYVVLIHGLAGFVFNNFMSYCMTRFPQYAGKASGLVGGGFAIVTSILSSTLANTIHISSQALLGLSYSILTVIVLVLIVKTKWITGEPPKASSEEVVKEQASEKSFTTAAIAEA